MIRPPPISTRPDTLFPDTTRFRSLVPIGSARFSSPAAPVRKGEHMAAIDLIELMITRSSNPATDALLAAVGGPAKVRSEEHTSELQSLMRISYAVFCLKKNTKQHNLYHTDNLLLSNLIYHII